MARPNSKLVTSTDYSHPYHPRPVRLLNRLGSLAASAGFKPSFDLDDMIATARRKTGLAGFGDEWFIDPLKKLLWSYEHEANFTTMGRIIQRGRIVGALQNRLRIEELTRRHPQILEIDLGKILVVIGLQRTGTTMLHRLLSADPRARSLISWEALNPVPFDLKRHGSTAARRRQAQQAEKGLAYLAPDFFAIHPVEADAPEEDVLLLDLSFMSQAPEAVAYVPTYAAWLEQQDYTNAYRDLKKTLQVLHWQSEGAHWVLKTPHHMECLEVMSQVFPEARFVETHRDPQKTHGSFCSMVAHGSGVFSDQVDARKIGEHWLRKLSYVVEKAMTARTHIGAERFFDVSYYDLLDDPVKQIQQIYNFAGMDLPDPVLKTINDSRTTNKQHKYGRHVYDIADFGLTPQKIDQAYSAYRKKYAIPYEDKR